MLLGLAFCLASVYYVAKCLDYIEWYFQLMT